MADFIDIQRKFVSALLRIPGIEDFNFRTLLLQGLPSASLVRIQASSRADLNSIIDGLRSLGRLNNQGGTRPLVVVAENALSYVPEGGEVANEFKEVIRALNEHYGGEVQLQPSTFAAGETEALIFGRQRDNRVRIGFIEGALRVARSIARLSVPRIFNGVSRSGQFSYGTGWLIAPGLLITNHHVIEARDVAQGELPATPTDFEAQAQQVSAWFDYRLENGSRLECQNGELVHQNRDLDYALVRLAQREQIADRSPIRLTKQQTELVRGNRLNIAQHPGGGALQFAIRNNFFVRPGNTNDFLRYQTDTERGSSGSPVCNDLWEVVALHHSSTPVPPSLVPQEVIDGQPVEVTVLNEAIAIHSVLNSLPAVVREEILAAQAALG